MPDASLEKELRATGIDGIFFILNLPKTRLNYWVVDRLFGKLLARLVNHATTFDHRIEDESMTAACQWLADICGTPVKCLGAELIPENGPVLFASNHPGYFDTMVIAAQLPRQDLKVLVGGVPYFLNMPNIRKHIIYTDHTPASSVKALRESIWHLKKSGCVLIYPTGQADPDPDVVRGARNRYEDWSHSIALLLRRVPETRLVSTVVSGILNIRYLRHPFARIQPNSRYRQRVAEFFQLFAQFNKTDSPPLSSPRITFGKPIVGRKFLDQYGKDHLMSAVIQNAQDVHDKHMSSLN